MRSMASLITTNTFLLFGIDSRLTSYRLPRNVAQTVPAVPSGPYNLKQKSAKEIGPDVAGQTASCCTPSLYGRSCPLEFVLLRPKRYASSGKPLAARPTLAFCFQYWGSWRCCGRLPAGHARKAPISGDSYPLQHRVELADVNGPICLRGVADEP